MENNTMEKPLGFRKVFYKAGRTAVVSQQISKIRVDYTGSGKRNISRIFRKTYTAVIDGLVYSGWTELA